MIYVRALVHPGKESDEYMSRHRMQHRDGEQSIVDPGGGTHEHASAIAITVSDGDKHALDVVYMIIDGKFVLDGAKGREFLDHGYVIALSRQPGKSIGPLIDRRIEATTEHSEEETRLP